MHAPAIMQRVEGRCKAIHHDLATWSEMHEPPCYLKAQTGVAAIMHTRYSMTAKLHMLTLRL